MSCAPAAASATSGASRLVFVITVSTLHIFATIAPPGGVHMFRLAGQLSHVCAESVHIFACFYPRIYGCNQWSEMVLPPHAHAPSFCATLCGQAAGSSRWCVLVCCVWHVMIISYMPAVGNYNLRLLN